MGMEKMFFLSGSDSYPGSYFLKPQMLQCNFQGGGGQDHASDLRETSNPRQHNP